MPSQPGSGSGGGGAGGGEYASDKFTGPTRGGNGWAAMVSVTRKSVPYNTKLNVKINDVNFVPLNLENPWWETYTFPISLYGGSFTLNPVGWSNSRGRASRSYGLSPFKIGTRGTQPYTEFVDIGGFKSDIGLATSKAQNGGVNLKLLYSKSQNHAGINYSSNAMSFSGDSQSFSIDSTNAVTYTWFLLQGGGGGGGGADNSWGLFNYAAGGGGGGGGGANVYRARLENRVYHITITVGSGGAAGSNGSTGSAGSVGNPTTLIIRYDNSSGAIAAQVTATGGGPGTGGSGNNAGNGGARGQTTVNSNAGGLLTKVCIVDGGVGGKVGTGGAVAYSGTFSDTMATSLFDWVFSAPQTFGAGGTVGSQDDRGGGGGASYLGNGGYYD